MKVSNKVIISSFLAYRFLMTLFSIMVISKMTTLGDYAMYINSDWASIIKAQGVHVFLNSTQFTKFMVGFVRFICLNNKLLTNIVFNIFTSLGLLYIIKKTNYSNFIIVMLMMPNFTIWSSYASKESFVVFATCIIMGIFISIANDYKLTKAENRLSVICLYFVILFKPQYLPALLVIYLYLVCRKGINQGFRIFILLSVCVFVFYLYCVFSDFINSFFSTFSKYFISATANNRNMNAFSVENGFSNNLFYGMILALWGPSITDLSNGLLQVVAFFESSFLFLCIFITLCRQFIYQKVDYILLTLIVLFFLLVVQYPFSFFNAGAAIRYRTNLYVILVGYIFILLKNGSIKKTINTNGMAVMI